jgi:(1->4)-alpha-D-glucan 1-alpha-D-glucosylmutase
LILVTIGASTIFCAGRRFVKRRAEIDGAGMPILNGHDVHPMAMQVDFYSPEDAAEPSAAPAKANARQEASNDMRACVEQTLHADARVPVSTYRVQVHKDFTFAAAAGIAGYLKKLGIGDFYSSPIFEARPGSMHGYDVTRHDRLNPELGGDEGFERFSEELKHQGLGLLLDIVPNHMGVGNDSIWWQDVLENGHASSYSEYFDIDWKPLKTAMRNKLLLPILGDQYGAELEAKHIQVSVEDGRPLIHYYDHTMPMAPRTLPILLGHPDASAPMPEPLADLLRRLENVPPHETANEDLREQRRAQLAELLPQIREALRSPDLQPLLQQSVATINGVEGDGHSFDRLHLLLDAQPYRLASWRTSAEEINYRRFFDVNDLVGLRMENPVVFAETHCLIRALIADQKVTGLRIDHCDGMFNPRQYLIRLQLLFLASQCAGGSPKQETAANGIERSILDPVRGYDWSKSQGALYTVVEKILEPREYLPPEWPVRGTSGYDFVYLANGIFIQKANEKRFDAIYAHVLGHPADPDEIIYRSKLQVMQTALASEVYVLTNLLSRIAAANRRARDFTDNILETVLRETIASFPVYRTYIDDRGEYTERDVAFLRSAIAKAKRLNPDINASAFDFLRETLLLESSNPATHRQQKPNAEMLYFALKFQQLTGPVMAKGVEDTTFYVYTRFLSSNEVGGSTKSFGISLETLHQSNQERLTHSPDSMLTTSTHDTKRSEDVRNRLNVLSELPQPWSLAIRRWQRMNQKFKQTLEDGRTAPDNNEEYLLYQTILGAWPWQMETLAEREAFAERIRQYASKALSEAKVNLSWINPDPEYMKAVHTFITSILMPGARGKETAFVSSLNGLLPQLRLFGAVNSLAQVVLKITVPGVPDFFQGSELWDLSLVDPDNRRPVDYTLRARTLDDLHALEASDGAAAVCAEVLAHLEDGRVKLWTTHRALTLRREQQALFRKGAYTALTVNGERQEHVIAFERRDSATGTSVLVVLPRFASTLMRGKLQLPLGDAWGKDLLLIPGSADATYRNVFTGETVKVTNGAVALSTLFAQFPVAMLITTA